MTDQDLFERVSKPLHEGDAATLDSLLAADPSVLHTPWHGPAILESAAQDGRIAILEVLVRHGADINFAPVKPHRSRPLSAAVYQNQAATVRWLLEHGAEVNSAAMAGHHSFCQPLASAIRGGHLDIVRVLVEAGAKLDVLDYRDLTPLSWALLYGQKEVAEYLRSKGAVEAHEAPGYAERMEANRLPPLLEWVRDNLGGVSPLSWFAVVPDEVPVTIHGVCGAELHCLLTHGMSERPMAVPPGGDAYRYAELVLHLDVWDTDVTTWNTPERLWAIDWARRLAQIPFENGTWLGGKWTIISNEDPPQPLSEFTEMTCWLLLGEKEPLARADLPDGKSVVFYTLLPIHTAERDLALREGLVALLERFAEREVPTHLDPHRESVA